MDITVPDELSSYYIPPSENTIKFIENVIKHIGFDKYFEDQLTCFLDCTKVWKTGQRPVMTSYKNYVYEISNTIVAINLFAGSRKGYFYNVLFKRHLDNLEFEANNPYEYKSIKVKQSNPRKKVNKQLTIENLDDKPKKETAAERKLKQLAIKLNKLSFNFKPAQ